MIIDTKKKTVYFEKDEINIGESIHDKILDNLLDLLKFNKFIYNYTVSYEEEGTE